MSARYRSSDPTANAAVKAADKAPGLPKDIALVRAAEAKRRGDMAGYERFMAAAMRSSSTDGR